MQVYVPILLARGTGGRSVVLCRCILLARGTGGMVLQEKKMLFRLCNGVSEVILDHWTNFFFNLFPRNPAFQESFAYAQLQV